MRRRSAGAKTNPSLLLPKSDYSRIGIVWSDNSNHRSDRQRDCPLHEFLPILSIPEIAFYSLQRGARREDLAHLPSHIQVHDLEPQLGDFADLAVVIDQLDLVISVDSPAAHMASALGKKDLDAAESRSGLALDVRGREHAVVSHDAPVSPDPARRLDRRDRTSSRSAQ